MARLGLMCVCVCVCPKLAEDPQWEVRNGVANSLAQILSAFDDSTKLRDVSPSALSVRVVSLMMILCANHAGARHARDVGDG